MLLRIYEAQVQWTVNGWKRRLSCGLSFKKSLNSNSIIFPFYLIKFMIIVEWF